MRERTRLHKTGNDHLPQIYLNDDLTNSERRRRRELLPLYKTLRGNGFVRIQLRRDALFQDGRRLSEQELDRLLNGIAGAQTNSACLQSTPSPMSSS